jgi:transcriptional regulator with XRE-family HTH domain
VKAIARIAQARLDAGLSSKELAERLGVDVTTVSNWESGRRQLTLERLKEFAGLLGFSASYLLGEDVIASHVKSIDKAQLPTLHRTPVWTSSFGWSLVNVISRTLVFADKRELAFDEVQEPLYAVPPLFAFSLRGVVRPLSLQELPSREKVWVEPISTDPELASELRGWYHLRKQRLVENEFGNRFYLDTYGAKWLAFGDCLQMS